MASSRRADSILAHLVPAASYSSVVNELVPFGFDQLPLLQSKEVRATLRWMKQKDDLEQDMILLGGYGPLRRWIALRYCEERQREVEYVALTQDTTEADLKQRREITAGGNVVYMDLAVVQAATHGQLFAKICPKSNAKLHVSWFWCDITAPLTAAKRCENFRSGFDP